MKFSFQVLLMSILLSVFQFASALEVQGVRFEETVKINGNDLQLNGAGLRTKYFFKVYVAGLYVPAKTRDAEAIIVSKQPRRLTLNMLRKMDAADIHEALFNGLTENNSYEQIEVLRTRIQQLEAILNAVKVVNAGDVIAFDFLPGQGTRVTVKGQVKDVIAGDDMAQAILRIWLGKKPAQSDLKKALLAAN